MTFRKSVKEDFPEGKLGDQTYENYKESNGCDDGKPKGWTPCFTDPTGALKRDVCSFWNTTNCPHKQGMENITLEGKQRAVSQWYRKRANNGHINMNTMEANIRALKENGGKMLEYHYVMAKEDLTVKEIIGEEL